MRRDLIAALAALTVSLFTFGAARAGDAKPLVHRLFSAGAVLQCDVQVPVWGWAGDGERISVEFAGQRKTAITGADGKWMVHLDAMKATREERVLKVTSEKKASSAVAISNVLVGEVWVCSGQSNMEKPIGIQPGQKPCPNYEQEIANADFPEIRLLEVPPKQSAQPLDEAAVEWLACSPRTIVIQRGGGHGFSACAYFFGRELYKELKVPVGLIAASYSGSGCGLWTPPTGDANNPGLLYNGMIRPLLPYAIRGAIWYQGEGNMGDGLYYFPRMKALIEGWRRAWGQGDFPFYFVQLPPVNAGVCSLPLTREAQRATLAVTNTGMAVTIDIGSYPDCHCPNKQEVGRRLALWALAKDYGRTSLVYSGPLYRSMSVEGDKIRVAFDHVGGGLTTRDGSRELTCFEIAGTNRVFVGASAHIEGSAVVVSNAAITMPAAVRLAWHDQSVPNLMNKEGLPVTTFSSETPR